MSIPHRPRAEWLMATPCRQVRIYRDRRTFSQRELVARNFLLPRALAIRSMLQRSEGQSNLLLARKMAVVPKARALDQQ